MMNPYTWRRAQAFAAALPSTAPWSFCITNEDLGGEHGDAVFNIFADRAAWAPLRVLLMLGAPQEDDPKSQSWHFEGLTLSLIEPEEQNVDDESAGPNAE